MLGTWTPALPQTLAPNTPSENSAFYPGNASPEPWEGMKGSLHESDIILKLKTAVDQTSISPSAKWAQGAPPCPHPTPVYLGVTGLLNLGLQACDKSEMFIVGTIQILGRLLNASVPQFIHLYNGTYLAHWAIVETGGVLSYRAL